MAFPGTKHGPRRRPYRVLWGKDGVRTVSASEWQRAQADKWIAPVKRDDGSLSDRVARVVDGVIVKVVDGVIHLKDAIRRVDYWIFTIWKRIDQSAPVVRGAHYQKELERQYAAQAPHPDADIVNRWGQFEGPYGVPVII